MASSVFSSRTSSGPSARARCRSARDTTTAPNRNKTNTNWFILGLIFSAATRFFRPFQQEIDAAFDVRVAIPIEMQLRDTPEHQPRCQFPAQIPLGMLQRFERLLLLALVSNRHFHRGIPRIW